MTLGQLSQKLNLNASQVRFWEHELGIKPRKNNQGNRIYDDTDILNYLEISQLHEVQYLPFSEIKKRLQSKTKYNNEFKFDIFISHASEDKDTFVRPLISKLAESGISIWYDETNLSWGDSLISGINSGIKDSRFAIVVLSEAFFRKKWTKFETNALMLREVEKEQKVVLPIWYKVNKEQVMSYNLNLADKVALLASDNSIEFIATSISNLLKSNRVSI